MPPQDVWKFPPVFYRTSALWGRCPALTPPSYWINPSRASGTADHVRSLDDLFVSQLLLTSKPTNTFTLRYYRPKSTGNPPNVYMKINPLLLFLGI